MLKILLIMLTVVGIYGSEEEIYLEQIGNTQLIIKSQKLMHRKDLDLSGYGLTDITPLSQIKSIISLNVSYNDFKFIFPLIELTNLKSLNISGCHAIEDLPEVGKIISLSSLNMSNLHDVIKGPLDYLSSLVNLRSLFLRKADCLTNQDLYPLTGLPRLRKLNLYECELLTDYSCLDQSKSLRKIILSIHDPKPIFLNSNINVEIIEG